MRQHKLRLEDLSVESFNTEEEARHGGTVRAYEEAEPGTIFSWCHSCPNTCDEHTCGNTCAGMFTCDYDRTCSPQYTCGGPDCGGSDETVIYY
jgi:hypothetical protein